MRRRFIKKPRMVRVRRRAGLASKAKPQMAVVRCDTCARKVRRPHGRPLEPIGYPNLAVICGMPHCSNPGLVWVWGRDLVDYRANGRTCFAISKDVKVQVKPPNGR